jgi:hypothetical protein
VGTRRGCFTSVRGWQDDPEEQPDVDLHDVPYEEDVSTLTRDSASIASPTRGEEPPDQKAGERSGND